jgi:outer membrane protein OmpA-like peptidoglycan-associated protein
MTLFSPARDRSIHQDIFNPSKSKNMKHFILPIITFFGLAFSASAQLKSKKEIRGDHYSFIYSFQDAIGSYTHVKHLTVEGQRNLAKSYHNLGQDAQAEVAYSKLVDSPDGVVPEDYYNYAMVLKSNNKYDESAKWMVKFTELKPSDLRSIDYKAHCSELGHMSADMGNFKVMHPDVNTDADDFGASYFTNKVVFASSRSTAKMIKREYNWTGKPFLDMYVSEVDKDQLKDPEFFNKKMNGKMHDGPASFSNNGTFMAFSRNTVSDKSKDKVVEVQIYFSSFKEGKWSKAQPFLLNDKGYSVGHPCLTPDGNTMYFTSDMPGGYGGADIYRITKNDKGEWMSAENLGNKINTEGDELFPFIETKNQVFFFTSNGRFGMGGLDVFICGISGNGFTPVYNAGYPMNTRYDDFAVVMDDKLEKGYFSSNRAGGSGGDDIYSFDLLKSLEIGKKINGVAMDKDHNLLPGTSVTLTDEKGKVIETFLTKEDGSFIFWVSRDKSFTLTGKKDAYKDDDTVVNTFSKEMIVKADLTLLKKGEVNIQDIRPGTDLGQLPEVNQSMVNRPIYFDLDKSDIRPDAKTELDKIIKIMNKYPNMVVQLSAYTDSRASKEYNQLLSDKRAKSTIAYIKAKITHPERISGKGYGETKLVNNCSGEGSVVCDCSETDHQMNRRTEFIVIKN